MSESEIPTQSQAAETPGQLPVLPILDEQERIRRMVRDKTDHTEMTSGACHAVESFRMHNGYLPFPLEGSPCENCPRRD